MQIIPAIDLRGGLCVRLMQGDYAQETMFGDDPPAMARRWEYEGAERLHLVDLDGAKAGRPVNLDAIRAIVEEVHIPCQLGGGIRDEAAMRRTYKIVIEAEGRSETWFYDPEGLAQVLTKKRAWVYRLPAAGGFDKLLGIAREQ